VDLLGRIKSKNLQTWMRGYARHLVASARAPRVDGTRHLLFALCDHYEPLWGKAAVEVGRSRVKAWEEGYPRMAQRFRDADGRPPRHSFFFPGEEYRPEFLDSLGRLVKGGYGEVEFHLHHDGDTAATLRPQIEGHLATFARHGHLSRDPDGKPVYAFIHGNWSLANSRPDGRWCGVDDELPVLFETGCYADFTFPSAPDACQPDIVNQIYWPVGDLTRRKSFEQGERARVGASREDRLLMIQGPLALTRKAGRMAVRIENGALTGDDPPTEERVVSWVDQNIHVAGRPEWVFCKVHTHGAIEDATAALLGAGGEALHTALAKHYNDGVQWKLHYVTAREMYNVARAAMDGKSGDPDSWRDYVVRPPPIVGG
jgi:hypothetical protein